MRPRLVALGVKGAPAFVPHPLGGQAAGHPQTGVSAPGALLGGQGLRCHFVSPTTNGRLWGPLLRILAKGTKPSPEGDPRALSFSFQSFQISSVFQGWRELGNPLIPLCVRGTGGAIWKVPGSSGSPRSSRDQAHLPRPPTQAIATAASSFSLGLGTHMGRSGPRRLLACEDRFQGYQVA